MKLWNTQKKELQLQEGDLKKARVVKLDDDAGFRVIHEGLEKILKRYDFEQDDALYHFARLLKKYRIEELLEKEGAKEGDTVVIGEIEFEYQPEQVQE